MTPEQRAAALAALVTLQDRAEGDAATWMLPGIQEEVETIRKALTAEAPVEWGYGYRGTRVTELAPQIIARSYAQSRPDEYVIRRRTKAGPWEDMPADKNVSEPCDHKGTRYFERCGDCGETLKPTEEATA
jgi:hypothetical protein